MVVWYSFYTYIYICVWCIIQHCSHGGGEGLLCNHHNSIVLGGGGLRLHIGHFQRVKLFTTLATLPNYHRQHASLACPQPISNIRKYLHMNIFIYSLVQPTDRPSSPIYHIASAHSVQCTPFALLIVEAPVP